MIDENYTRLIAFDSGGASPIHLRGVPGCRAHAARCGFPSRLHTARSVITQPAMATAQAV
jgi:hypothetical protein